MVNKNYRKGVAHEYRVKKQYEKVGYLVVRSSGSHSPYDLICLKRFTEEDKKIYNASGRILFIQCKPKNFSEKKAEKIIKEGPFGIFFATTLVE